MYVVHPIALENSSFQINGPTESGELTENRGADFLGQFLTQRPVGIARETLFIASEASPMGPDRH